MVRSQLFRAVPLAAMAAGLAAVLFLCSVLVDREEPSAQKRTEEQAKHLANQLRTGIHGVVQSLDRMGIWWTSQGKPLARDDWDSDAQLFLQNNSGLREVSWVDLNGVQIWSHKLNSGLNRLSSQPRLDVHELVEIARQQHAAAFSKVIDLM